MDHRTFLLAALLIAVPAGTVFAAGTDAPAVAGAPDVSRELEGAKAAIEQQQYPAAVSTLQRAERKDPDNANVQNWLGYAFRKQGQLDPAFKHYKRALELDPKHRGAHEYIGEAYLMNKQPEKGARAPGAAEDDLRRGLRGIPRPGEGHRTVQAPDRPRRHQPPRRRPSNRRSIRRGPTRRRCESAAGRVAEVLPSSTPHWSKLLMPHTAPQVKTRCSYSASSRRPATRGPGARARA